MLRRFQSIFVKSIFLEIGVLGGAAKLNQTFFTLRLAAALELLPWLTTRSLISLDSLVSLVSSTLVSRVSGMVGSNGSSFRVTLGDFRGLLDSLRVT